MYFFFYFIFHEFFFLNVLKIDKFNNPIFILEKIKYLDLIVCKNNLENLNLKF